nr:PREDICTED: uncharacterized protein LOC107801934 isoform X2 [Nicotiana tabacum]
MTCSNCGEPNHNGRGCYKPKAAATQEDAAMESDNEDVGPFAATQAASCNADVGPFAATQAASCNADVGPFAATQAASCNADVGPFAATQAASCNADVGPFAAAQEFTPYGPEVDNEEDPPLRPMIISETQSRIERGNLRGPTTGVRKIKFAGDHTGASTPTNIPYSPTKLTWKGKAAISSSQVQLEARKRNIKMMATKGKGVSEQ